MAAKAATAMNLGEAAFGLMKSEGPGAVDGHDAGIPGAARLGGHQLARGPRTAPTAGVWSQIARYS